MIGECGEIAALACAPEALGNAAQEHRHDTIDRMVVDGATCGLRVNFGPGFAAHGTPLHSWKLNVVDPS
jgi:hypothetical protein